jgi:hypothetical protein
MCANKNYENCDLNIFNFFFILCLYNAIFSYHNVTALLVNLPVILITLPFLPVVLFLYLFYLFALPLADVLNLFFPSLSVVLIPVMVFFITGVANIRLSKVFKVR